MPPSNFTLQPHFGIEMMNVGKGDAIFVELLDHRGISLVLLIDGGGEAASAKTIAQHGEHHRGKTTLVFSTHPDQDHLGGIRDFINSVRPAALFLNSPLGFADRNTLTQRARTYLSEQCRGALTAALDRTENVISMAQARNVRIINGFVREDGQPFFIWGGWRMYVLNPTRADYAAMWNPENFASIYDEGDDENLVAHARTRNSVLDDGTDTTGMNNSSIVLLVEGYGQKFLFTGDAGMRALYDAARRRDIANLQFLDIPHHGSRRNLNSPLIEHMRPRIAFVSAPEASDKHPRDEVIAKFQAVGTHVVSTHHNNMSIYHHSNFMLRQNYIPANIFPLLLPPARG